MVRSALSKVMWVGRATVFLVGLAVIVGVVFGLASTAFGANGKPFILGQKNTSSNISKLIKSGVGPALQLGVGSGPPLAVNSSKRVANLNADKVDGLSLACPSGTLFHEGVCIERALRATSASFPSAQSDCLDEPGTRLPTPGELQTLEGRTAREWSNHAYTDFGGTSNFNVDIMVEPDGTLGTFQQGGLGAYRCVKQPK
jgi:hypothetical protein